MPKLSIKFIKIAVTSSMLGLSTGLFASKMIGAVIKSSENDDYNDNEEILYYSGPFDQ